MTVPDRSLERADNPKALKNKGKSKQSHFMFVSDLFPPSSVTGKVEKYPA